MTVEQMVAAVKAAAKGKPEKPTKGLTEWTGNADLAKAMAALGFTVVEAVSTATSPGATGRVYWRLNCNGNRFRGIVKLLRASGAAV